MSQGEHAFDLHHFAILLRVEIHQSSSFEPICSKTGSYAAKQLCFASGTDAATMIDLAARVKTTMVICPRIEGRNLGKVVNPYSAVPYAVATRMEKRMEVLRSFVVRIYRDDPNGTVGVLEAVESGEVMSFHSREELWAGIARAPWARSFGSPDLPLRNDGE
jgi:hypothetical protein